MAGFVKLWRSDDFWQLAKDHPAFVLAAVIAVRARRTDGLALHGLAIGEALLGDYREYGMTEGQYREAKKRLEGAGFATFRTTNKGTIARLLFTGVFDPNLEIEQRTTQQTNNEQGNGQATNHTTTNKDRRESFNKKDKGISLSKPLSLPESHQLTAGERTDYPNESVKKICTCRPEFSKLNPETIAGYVHATKDNPRFEQNLADFLADASNALEPPRNPTGMLRAYLNKIGSKQKQTGRRGTL